MGHEAREHEVGDAEALQFGIEIRLLEGARVGLGDDLLACLWRDDVGDAADVRIGIVGRAGAVVMLDVDDGRSGLAGAF